MPICKICGVNDPRGAWGYCGKHYMRVRRYGNPDYVTPEHIRAERCRNAQPTLNKCKPTTYKKYRGRHMHRVIAEAKLGRPLLSSEHVHHIDGNRHNNEPSNLIVLTMIEHLKVHGKERRGKAKSNSKFNEKQIREIRSSPLSNKEVAKKFNVNPSLILQIRKRKIYVYVE